MVIILTGGGSGGHVTPLVAIADELKKLAPKARLVYIGQKGDRFARVVTESQSIDQAVYIRAGKFRRYHGEGWRQLLDLKTMILNARDLFMFMIGVVQSWVVLGRLKPAAIFIKGGFVGVPVGLAAASRKVPFVTHDSDAIPGLANRLIAKWASYHAVALPASEYKNYSPETTIQVGIPVSSVFSKVNTKQKEAIKKELGLASFKRILLITGGGLGALRLNDYITEIVPGLLATNLDLGVVHLTGDKQQQRVEASYDSVLDGTKLKRVRVIGFTDEMAKLSSVADVIITRAGATTLAEFAAQEKACIVVPSPNLAGGHQLKNAELLDEKNAALMVKESNEAPANLLSAINELLNNSGKRNLLASNLNKTIIPGAAGRLAELIMSLVALGKSGN